MKQSFQLKNLNIKAHTRCGYVAKASQKLEKNKPTLINADANRHFCSNEEPIALSHHHLQIAVPFQNRLPEGR